MTSVDVLIIGGGPVGITLASALTRFSLTVALVDDFPICQFLDSHYDGRTMAIAYGSRLILEDLGIWKKLEKHAQPIYQIRVSNGGGKGFVHYDHKEVKAHPMGYMIENRYLRHILYHHQTRLQGLLPYVPLRLEKLSWEPHQIKAFLSNGEEISAKLCIGADGSHSKVRDIAGLKKYEWSYGQTALVCMVKGTKPHQGIAFEHFMPQGPLAFLPVKDDFLSVVWTVPSEAASYFLNLDEEAFIKDLQDRFGEILGTLSLKSKRWDYPLKGYLLKSFVAPRLALVGDAAHVIHPVAGQGLNLGLRDVDVLAKILKEALDLGMDLGEGNFLKKYEKNRRLDILSMTFVNDGLVRLFSNESRSLNLLRGLGLDMVEKLSPLKKALTRHAMGLSSFIQRG